jgi:hypothetical protein
MSHYLSDSFIYNGSDIHIINDIKQSSAIKWLGRASAYHCVIKIQSYLKNYKNQQKIKSYVSYIDDIYNTIKKYEHTDYCKRLMIDMLPMIIAPCRRGKTSFDDADLSLILKLLKTRLKWAYSKLFNKNILLPIRLTSVEVLDDAHAYWPNSENWTDTDRNELQFFAFELSTHYNNLDSIFISGLCSVFNMIEIESIKTPPPKTIKNTDGTINMKHKLVQSLVLAIELCSSEYNNTKKKIFDIAQQIYDISWELNFTDDDCSETLKALDISYIIDHSSYIVDDTFCIPDNIDFIITAFTTVKYLTDDPESIHESYEPYIKALSYIVDLYPYSDPVTLYEKTHIFLNN